MRNPKTGRLDHRRMGWENTVTGGRRLGSSVDYNVLGMNVDGNSLMGYWLGFAKGQQYSGLSREEAPGTIDEISNCFVSTYATLTSMDNLAYNWETLTSDVGQFKLFDVLISNPTLIMSDSFVTYEMCDTSSIIDQAKNMASLDYASMADNFVREGLVVFLDSPEVREQMAAVREAGTCLSVVAKDAAKDLKDVADQVQGGESE